MLITDRIFLQDGIEVEFLDGPTATVAWVSTANMDFSASGEAKCCPNDVHDAEVGRVLAVARALESLAEVMSDYAIKRSHVLTHTGSQK